MFSHFFKLTIFSIILVVSGCQFLPKSNDISLELTATTKDNIIDRVYKQQQEINLCNQQRDEKLSPDSANIYVLNQDQYLIEVICFLGAYQSNYQYLLYQPKSEVIKVIKFAVFDNSTEQLKLTNSNTLNGIVSFDKETQILTLITKSRGLGDCGSFAKYLWINNGFELKEYRYKKDCDENYIEPEKYPLIYP